jgi:hypothetical protein
MNPSTMAKGNNSMPESVLTPPKNLPDLAKDLFGIDQGSEKSRSELESYATSLKNSPNQIPKLTSRMPIEPTSISVPKLDINLIKDRFVDNTPAIANMSAVAKENTNPINAGLQIPNNDLRLIIEKAIADYLASMNSAVTHLNISPGTAPNIRNIMPHNIVDYNINPQIQDRSSSFFSEFEKYIMQGSRNDNINKSVINELLSGNLLDKMRHFHDENEKVLSSKFAELEDLEKLWIISMERSKSADLLNESLESEILYKSDHIKKLLTDYDLDKVSKDQRIMQNQMHNKKMPFDIFQMLRRKDDNQKTDTHAIVSKSTNNNVLIKDNTEDLINKYNRSALSFEKDIINNIVISDPSKYFYVCDGVVVRSIRELISALARMSDTTYNYHVTHERNDFANWIREIFNQPELADAVILIKSRAELLNFLVRSSI